MRSQSKLPLILAALLACAALAPARAQDSTASAPSLYPVHGVVLNSATRQPIARALVDGQSDAMLTDNEGRFELNLSGEVAQIAVRRPGFRENGPDAMHFVRLGANMPGLTFFLAPQAAITGHVTLSTEDEADGILFNAYRLQVEDGRRQWQSVESATTNSEGVFRFPNLNAPGSYVICSTPAPDSTGASRGGPHSGFPGVCYPGPISASANPSPANILALRPGQQAEIEIHLAHQPFYPVSIAVPNAVRGQGIGIRIRDASGRNASYAARWNPQQGVAEVNLPNGAYYADAITQERQTQMYGRVDFRVANGPVSELNMTLLPLHPIPVEIRRDFAESAQPEGENIVNRLESRMGAGLNLNLTPADTLVDGGWGGGGLQPVPGASDNTQFQIEMVVPGRYWVHPFPVQGYISSITSGGVDLTREPLVVGPGNSTAPILITLRNDSGTIECTVNFPSGAGFGPDSAPGELTAAFVYAIPADRPPAHLQPATMQGPGQATLSNLAPGTYQVVAFDQQQEIDLTDPQAVARFAAKAQTVTVTAGVTSTVQLDLVHVESTGSTSQTSDGMVVQ